MAGMRISEADVQIDQRKTQHGGLTHVYWGNLRGQASRKFSGPVAIEVRASVPGDREDWHEVAMVCPALAIPTLYSQTCDLDILGSVADESTLEDT